MGQFEFLEEEKLTFAQAVYFKRLSWDDVDNFLTYWRINIGRKKSFLQCIGCTREEYGLFMMNPGKFFDDVDARIAREMKIAKPKSKAG